VRSEPKERLAGTALGWSFANTVASRFGTLFIGIALARLLGPDQFGRFAVAWVALIAVLAFNDLGVALAIVRWPEEPAEIAPTINTLSVLSSAVLALGMMAAAGPFAQAMGDPPAASLIRILAGSVVINGLVATPAAILQRTFRQGERMVIDQVNVWSGSLISIALAVAGAGASSLVIGRVVGTVVSGVLFLRLSPLPYRFGLDRGLARRLFSFGLPLAAASVLVFAISFIDQLVVGHSLGPRDLGYYVLAFNLASWPVSVMSGPLRSVTPALFARLRDAPAERRLAFEAVARPLAAVTLPGCIAIAASSPWIVQFCYGSAWAPAAGPLRWLAIFAACRIFFELAYDYLVIASSSVKLMAVQAVWLIGLVPGVLIGVATGGIAGAAAAQAVLGVAVIAPLYGWYLARSGLRVTNIFRALLLPLVSSIVLWGSIAIIGVLGWPVLALLLLACGLALALITVLIVRCRSDLGIWRTVGVTS
jgi:O-antigen/teichoic acid export membrane protein